MSNSCMRVLSTSGAHKSIHPSCHCQIIGKVIGTQRFLEIRNDIFSRQNSAVTAVTSSTAFASFTRGAAKSKNSTSASAPYNAAVSFAILTTRSLVNFRTSGRKLRVVPSSTACSATMLYWVPASNLPTPTTTVSRGSVFLETMV